MVGPQGGAAGVHPRTSEVPQGICRPYSPSAPDRPVMMASWTDGTEEPPGPGFIGKALAGHTGIDTCAGRPIISGGDDGFRNNGGPIPGHLHDLSAVSARSRLSDPELANMPCGLVSPRPGTSSSALVLPSTSTLHGGW